jgi:hypothetical protein
MPVPFYADPFNKGFKCFPYAARKWSEHFGSYKPALKDKGIIQNFLHNFPKWLVDNLMAYADMLWEVLKYTPEVERKLDSTYFYKDKIVCASFPCMGRTACSK